MEYMYTIYKVTNQIDGKFYIGSHKTKDLNDKYMGSGKYLKHAQEKYGIENFKKEILFVFDTPEEMYAKEAEIVNADFLAEENTYNLKIGGFGGFDYINSSGLNNNVDKQNYEYIKIRRNAGLIGGVVTTQKDKENNTGLFSENIRKVLREKVVDRFPNGTMYRKQHSEETKQKMSEAASKRVGPKNSQHGTIWITNGSENKKIKKDSSIPEGWYKGRR